MNREILKILLSRCQWAHDDGSLNVENLPMAKKDAVQANLFNAAGGGA